MAPEMLKNQPYDTAVDIWGLGVLLYELLHGYPPFIGKTNREKCANIIMNQKITFDPCLTESVKDLIENILLANPNERLTMLEILNHRWIRAFEVIYKIKVEDYVNLKKLREQTEKNREETKLRGQVGVITTPLFGKGG